MSAPGWPDLGGPSLGNIRLGAYCGFEDPVAVGEFGTETHTTMQLYHDYLDGSSWSAMVGTAGHPTGPISGIEGDLGSMQFLCSVPLVSAGYASTQAALAAYNGADASVWTSNLTILAGNLVGAGFPNALIRLMWEPDSGIYSNGDLTSAANYAAIWRSAHTSMMGVSGAEFQWAWYWGGQFNSTTNNTAYPGNSYVDYITFDFYDQSYATGPGAPPYNGTPFTPAQANWLWQNSYGPLLEGLTNFATYPTVNKPIGLGEFGVISRSDNHGGGDDPTFIANLANWLNQNAIEWAAYYNWNSGGNSILADFPNSLAQFIVSFGS